MKCQHCREFFDEMGLHCIANIHGECDCPKCQGYCECNEGYDYDEGDRDEID